MIAYPRVKIGELPWVSPVPCQFFSGLGKLQEKFVNPGISALDLRKLANKERD